VLFMYEEEFEEYGSFFSAVGADPTDHLFFAE
jgi:hypothetical protein